MWLCVVGGLDNFMLPIQCHFRYHAAALYMCVVLVSRRILSDHM